MSGLAEPLARALGAGDATAPLGYAPEAYRILAVLRADPAVLAAMAEAIDAATVEQAMDGNANGRPLHPDTPRRRWLTDDAPARLLDALLGSEEAGTYHEVVEAAGGTFVDLSKGGKP